MQPKTADNLRSMDRVCRDSVFAVVYSIKHYIYTFWGKMSRKNRKQALIAIELIISPEARIAVLPLLF